MNKKVIVIVAALISIIAGATAYVVLAKDPQMTTPAPSSATVEAPQHPPTQGTAGVYTDYNAAALAKTEGTILLFFHASWCPQCRAIEKDIYEKGVPENVTVYKVDYDSNQALRKTYGVTLQTTFVRVDREGNKLASFVAYNDPTFSAVAQKLLP